MIFYKDLFLSNLITVSKEEIIDSINSGRIFFHTYIITLPLIPSENQLEIYHIELNKQFYFHEEDFIVMGIAKGYQDALELVEKITTIVYNETHTGNIKEYFSSKI